MSQVIGSPLIAAASSATATELWDLPDSIRAAWPGITLRSAFSTDVKAANSLSEERRALVGKPYRTLQFSVTNFHQSDTFAAMAYTARRATAGSPVPLYCDVSFLASPASGSTLTLMSAPSTRRFCVGGRVLVILPRRRLTAAAHELHRVSAIDDGAKTITLIGALASTFPAGSRVFPVIESRLQLASEFTVLNDAMLSGQFEAQETPGRSALSVLQAGNTVPAGMSFDDVDGLPIFDFALDWGAVKQGVARDGGYAQNGRAEVGQFYGTRPRFTFNLPLILKGRTESMRLVRFFESRMGRAFPFWFIDNLRMFIPSAKTSTTLDVPKLTPANLWNFIDHIGILLANGTRIVRRITSRTTIGDIDRLTMADALPSFNLADVKRMSAARLVRLSSDELVENWITDEHMRTSMGLIELLEEKDVTLGIASPSSGNAATDRFEIPDVCCDPMDSEAAPPPPPPATMYRLARLCVDGELGPITEVGMTEADAESIENFAYAGRCYGFNHADPTVDFIPSTLLTPGSVTETGSGGCATCEEDDEALEDDDTLFVQISPCVGNPDSRSLWLRVDDLANDITLCLDEIEPLCAYCYTVTYDPEAFVRRLDLPEVNVKFRPHNITVIAEELDCDNEECSPAEPPTCAACGLTCQAEDSYWEVEVYEVTGTLGTCLTGVKTLPHYSPVDGSIVGGAPADSHAWQNEDGDHMFINCITSNLSGVLANPGGCLVPMTFSVSSFSGNSFDITKTVPPFEDAPSGTMKIRGTLKNNRCCKCENDDCVATSDNSEATTTDCTASQDDGCPA